MAKAERMQPRNIFARVLRLFLLGTIVDTGPTFMVNTNETSISAAAL